MRTNIGTHACAYGGTVSCVYVILLVAKSCFSKCQLSVTLFSYSLVSACQFIMDQVLHSCSDSRLLPSQRARVFLSHFVCYCVLLVFACHIYVCQVRDRDCNALM